MSTGLILFYYGEAVAISAVDWKKWIRKRNWNVKSGKCAVEYCLKLCSLPGKSAIHKWTRWGCCRAAPAHTEEALPQSCALTFATFHSLNPTNKHPSSLPVVISVLDFGNPYSASFSATQPLPWVQEQGTDTCTTVQTWRRKHFWDAKRKILPRVICDSCFNLIMNCNTPVCESLSYRQRPS